MRDRLPDPLNDAAHSLGSDSDPLASLRQAGLKHTSEVNSTQRALEHAELLFSVVLAIVFFMFASFGWVVGVLSVVPLGVRYQPTTRDWLLLVGTSAAVPLLGLSLKFIAMTLPCPILPAPVAGAIALSRKPLWRRVPVLFALAVYILALQVSAPMLLHWATIKHAEGIELVLVICTQLTIRFSVSFGANTSFIGLVGGATGSTFLAMKLWRFRLLTDFALVLIVGAIAERVAPGQSSLF